MDETTRICSWCSARIPAGTAVCPKCGARLDGATAGDIPGLTVVDPKAKGRLDEKLPPDAVGSDAVHPPSDAVRLEMLKMEFEAQIENAGTVLMNPTGDESIDAGAPSPEAIAAHEAGLPDQMGPADETDLGDLATPWEEPGLEKRP